jgi:hypothetical protein
VSEDRKDLANHIVRQLLWSARNHLEAAETRVDAQYSAEESVTPLNSLTPFVRQEIAIYTGTAAEHLLRALLTGAGKEVLKTDMSTLVSRAKGLFPDFALHRNALRRVGRSRNAAIHEGQGPGLREAIINLRATEEFAHFVNRELQRVSHPVLGEFKEFDDFQDSEAASRALLEWESEVQRRIGSAARLFAAKSDGRDVEEVAALVELDREGWLAAADPAARYRERECPACGSVGFVIIDVEQLDRAGSIVEYANARRFFCVACGLDLDSSDWPFAGITDEYSDPDPDLFAW